MSNQQDTDLAKRVEALYEALVIEAGEASDSADELAKLGKKPELISARTSAVVLWDVAARVLGLLPADATPDTEAAALEIIRRVHSLGDTAADAENDNGTVRLVAKVGPALDGEEPHDQTWALRLRLQDWLRTVGLHLVDADSDNDSVWGVVEEVPADEAESHS